MVLTDLLSAVAMRAKKAENYSSETYVIDLAELREIVAQMLEVEALDA